MAVVTTSPSDVFIGAPMQVMLGGRDLGATTGPVTVRIIPEAITTPQINGIPGLLAMTDYLTSERVESELTLLEMSKANLIAALTGSTAPADDVTRTGGRRYSTASYKDLLLVLRGLDDATLVVNMPNTTCTSGLELSGADDAAVSPTLIFAGRYKLGQAFWQVIRKPITGIEFVAGITTAGRTDPLGSEIITYVRAISSHGRPVTYTQTGLPTGLVLSGATGSISGVIGGTTGPKAVVVTANDGLSTAKTLSFTWTVS